MNVRFWNRILSKNVVERKGRDKRPFLLLKLGIDFCDECKYTKTRTGIIHVYKHTGTKAFLLVKARGDAFLLCQAGQVEERR